MLYNLIQKIQFFNNLNYTKVNINLSKTEGKADGKVL